MGNLAKELNTAKVKPEKGFIGGYSLIYADTGEVYKSDCTVSTVPDGVFMGAIMATRGREQACYTGDQWI